MRQQFRRQNALLAVLTALFLLMGRAPGQAQTPLGGGLNGQVDYSSDFAFVDAIATAGAFHALNPGGGLDFNNLAPTDAHGYPTSDFAFYVNEIAPPTGTYKLVSISNTRPTVSLLITPGSVANVVWNATAHTLTADVSVASGASVFVLQFQNTGGGVSALHLYRPGYAQNNTAGNLYAAPFTGLLSYLNPTVLRFMDFHSTNGNIETDWADRSLPTDATQELLLSKTNLPVDGNYPTAGVYSYDNGVLTTGKGVCWEFIIALANQQNKDAWINVPITASPDYVTKLANLIKYGSDGLNPYAATQASPKWAPLNSGLHLWIEYSNEVWNDGFIQAHINRGLGLTETASGAAWGGGPCNLNYDNVNDVNTLGDRRVADHLKQISDIFKGVFGAAAINTRIRPVLAYQLAPYRFDTQLRYIEAVYGSPKNYFYALAIAPYFNLGDADANPNLGKQDVLNALSASIDGYQNGVILNDIVTLSTYYGLKMTAYEGGPDTFGPNNIQAKKDATLDPQMQTLTQRYLNIWYGKGGDQFNWFTLGAGSFDSQYGTYSITNDISVLNQPKELGYLAIRNETPPKPNAGLALPGELDARLHSGGGVVNSGGYYLRFIGAGSTFDYLVNAPAAGQYKIVVSAGDGNSAASPIDISLNDTVVGEDQVPASADNQFHDTPGLLANFNAGLNVVRLTVPNNRPYNINSLKIEKADGSGIPNALPLSNFYAFQPEIFANQTYSQTFEVHDDLTPAASITVTATSDNPALIPNANIQILTGSYNVYGFLFNRQLNITPTADQTGTANITVTISDGTFSRITTFQLKVTGGFTAAPVNLTAMPGNNTVALNWQQGTGGSAATSFTVYRSLTSGGPYDQIATGVTGTTYTDNTAVNGTKYYYVVVGTSSLGGDSGYSNEASATPFVAPAAPVLTVTAGYSYVTLSWTAVSGAISYNVKRSATPGGLYTLIGNVTGTTFLDQYLGQGQTFYYVVSAINAFGEGPNSNEAKAVTGPTVPGEIEARILSAPSLNYGASPYVKFIGAGSTYAYTFNAATAGQYDISVSAGDGANNQSYGVHTAEPLQIAVNNGAAQTVTVLPTDENVFLDTAPITANLAAGANTVTLTVPDNRPYDLNTIKITPHGQTLANALPLTSFYAFYPEIAANTSYTNLFEAHDDHTPSDQIVVTAFSDNQTLFPNANVQALKGDFVIYGTHFPRQLVATPAPNQSGSAIITVVVTDGGGLSRTMFFKLTVDAPVVPPAPTNLSATLDNVKTTLTWTASVGAATYNVYRGLKSGGPYTQIAAGLAAATYTDSGLTNGTTYYYVVTAASSAGESGYSNEASVTPQNISVGSGDGLYGQYYSGDDSSFTFAGKTPILQTVDPTVNFQYNTGGLNFNPRPFDAAVPNNNYTVRWTGKVLAPVTGNYVFTTITDDGSVLYLNGVKVVDNNHYQAATSVSSAALALTGGQQYTLEMDYYQGGGGGSAQLTWQYPGQAQQIIPQSQLYSGQTAGATVTGNITLEGVTNLKTISPAAPLGVFDIQFRAVGTTAPLYEFKSVTLATTAGSPNGKYTVSGIPAGTYDVWIKGGKNLAALVSRFAVSGAAASVPDVMLPAADSNNDNSVDSTDFTALIGAFNSDATIAGSGYDPAADFNFDGFVDSSDFTLLIGQFNNTGPN